MWGGTLHSIDLGWICFSRSTQFSSRKIELPAITIEGELAFPVDNDINRLRSRPSWQPGEKNRSVSQGQRIRSIKLIARRRTLAGRAPLSGRPPLPNRRLLAGRRAVGKTLAVAHRPLLTGRLIHFQITRVRLQMSGFRIPAGSRNDFFLFFMFFNSC